MEKGEKMERRYKNVKY